MALSSGLPSRRTALLLIFLYIDIVTAASTSRLRARDHDAAEPQSGLLEDGTLNCETERSNDYYGLGVRMGVYFAWFQAWIANSAVPSEVPSALDTNSIFLFAILCAMVRCAISGLLWQLDGVMLMHMAGGTIFSVLSIWGYRTCIYDIHGPVDGIRKFGGWGTHFRLLLSFGVSCFGLFLWGWGIHGSLDSDTYPGCEVVYTFMFSKVRADGGIRIFYIIICIGCMIYFGCMILASFVGLPPRIQRIIQSHREGDTGSRLRKQFATGLNQKQLRHIFYFLRIGNFLFIIYSMLLVEFTLNYNNVANLLGWRGHIGFPSQLIPTIIGVFGFCKVFWVRYREWKAPNYLDSTTKRTLLKPDPRTLVKIYSAKSNVDYEFAERRSNGEMDPLMRDQPVWLRMLVSWLPWLAALRWWNPKAGLSVSEGPAVDGKKDDEEKDPQTPQSPQSPIGHSATWSQDTTPKITHAQYRATWGSDATVRPSPTLPEVPKDVHNFGSLKRGRRWED